MSETQIEAGWYKSVLLKFEKQEYENLRRLAEHIDCPIEALIAEFLTEGVKLGLEREGLRE